MAVKLGSYPCLPVIDYEGSARSLTFEQIESVTLDLFCYDAYSSYRAVDKGVRGDRRHCGPLN